MGTRRNPSKRSAGAPRGGTSRVNVTIDRALKKAWDESRATLAETKVEGAHAWDVFWETVGRVIEHEPPLYLAGGMSTIKEFLAEHVGENERVARRNVRVAKLASPEDEAKFTVTKLDEALAYLEAKLGGLPSGRVPVAFDKVRIPVDGAPRGVPLLEATAAQIRAATRALDPKRASKTSPIATELARALRATPEAKGVEARYANGFVTLRKIPARSFVAVMRALAKAKVPTE